MERQLIAPHESEGFEKIFHVCSEEEVNLLLLEWGAEETAGQEVEEEEYHHRALSSDGLTSTPTTTATSEAASASTGGGGDGVAGACAARLIKFPKTPHVINLGAATRTDKVLSSSEFISMFTKGGVCAEEEGEGMGMCRVYVEEKIDGANMGISLDLSSGKVVCQNRSHYITSSYHAQFAPLDKWIARHTADLWSILVPWRHVLYGEWMHATHSIYYDKLPSLFVAYDLFDRQSGSFVSRDVLQRLLSATQIPIVPLLLETDRIESVDQLLSLMKGPSAYSHSSSSSSSSEISSSSSSSSSRSSSSSSRTGGADGRGSSKSNKEGNVDEKLYHHHHHHHHHHQL